MRPVTHVPVWPLIAAFAAAALVSALVGSGRTPEFLPFAIVVTAILTLIFGLPAYIVLRSRLPAAWWTPVLVGFSIGAAPVLLLIAIGTPDYASSGGTVTVQDGVRTWAGWQEAIAFGFMGGLPGAAGGFAFWAVLKASGALSETAAKARRRHVATVVLVIAAVGTVAAFVLPSRTVDQSCHNSARDGRRLVTPELVAALDVGPAEWDDVRALMKDFSNDHEWSFRESLAGSVDSYAALEVSVCAEPGMAFSVMQHYANPDAFPSAARQSPPNMSMMVTVTLEQRGEAWREPGKDFLDRLQAAYGARLAFKNAQGQTISRAEAEAGPYRQD